VSRGGGGSCSCDDGCCECAHAGDEREESPASRHGLMHGKDDGKMQRIDGADVLGEGCWRI
jgi:hypothetical protein